MKGKYLIPIVLLSLLMISSVAAFWHEPPPTPECGTAFALAINDYFSVDSDDRFNFTEPEFQYCDTFTVEVWLLNVEDLYGYDFAVWGLHWPEYFELVGFKYAEFQDLMWGAGNWYKIYPASDYALSEPYRQAVTAKKPAVGTPLGDYKLAELTFHIKNDVCWCQEDVLGRFDFDFAVASDSCSSPIKLCDEFPVYYRFIPVQPKIYLTPKYEENCKIGDTFKMKVMIQNVVKMKSLHFILRWRGNNVWDYNSGTWIWIKMLCTSEDAIVVNPALFPPDKIDTLNIDLNDYGTDPVYYDTSEIVFDLVMKDTYPPINVTAATWAVEIEFTKQDPWYCGRQPDYDPVPPHEFEAENATTEIYFWEGYFDVLCPDPCNIYFGRHWWPEGSTKGIRKIGDDCVADFAAAEFEFDPVEGDLNGDGEVTIADLKIIADYYDHGMGWYPDSLFTARGYYYDLNDSGGVIDIFDIVIVAKHFGDKCAGHSIP